MNNMIKVQGLEEKVRQLYVAMGSVVKVGKELHIAPTNVSKILRDQGITITGTTGSGRKSMYSCNEDFFEVIDTEQKAYWLGFLYADGYVTAEKLTGISLSTNDEAHLYKFKEHISFTGNITRSLASFSEDYRETSKSRIILRSLKMFTDLNRHGVVLKKTLVLKFPTIGHVPMELTHHFVRGYFDGDGSVYASKASTVAFNILGTKEFLWDLRQLLPIESNAKLYKENRSDVNTWYITIGGVPNARRFYNYVYDNATVFLERKKEKFKQLLNI